MKLSEELKWRGILNQTTLSDITDLDNGTQVFYHGFDASAPSQTIGNLAAMMVDLVFLRHQYKGILLAGGSTSLIGDPSGKDKERPMQTIEDIQHNVSCAEKQINQIYRGHDITLVNNIDWTKDVSVIDYLRDIGKYFNVGEMIKRDYIANRLGEGNTGISYTEFSYSLLQGMDYLHLYEKHNCTLQIGGSDQWGNCLAGTELIRRKLGKEVHVITLPLIINKTTGKKFGKSEAGAIWLDAEKTSVFDFYQFWINTDDTGCREYVKIYTDIIPAEYDQLVAEADQNPSERVIQKYLAYQVTKLVHGSTEADKARETAENLFSGNVDINDPTIPSIQIIDYIHDDAIDMVELLADTDLVTSKRQAREFIDTRSISIDDKKISSHVVNVSEINLPALLRIGKKKFVKIFV